MHELVTRYIVHTVATLGDFDYYCIWGENLEKSLFSRLGCTIAKDIKKKDGSLHQS
jgi:hypothetical protein